MPLRKNNNGRGTAGNLPGKKDGSLADLARAAGFHGQGIQMAVAIAMAESSGNAQARGTNTDGSIDRGLWQINNRANPQVSDSCAYDPLCSARAAYKISAGGTNWGPWTTFHNNAYLAYLGATGDYRYFSDRPINPALSTNEGTPSGTAGANTDNQSADNSSGPTLSLGSIFSITAGEIANFTFDAFIKFPAILIGDYLIIPLWHWNQRAVQLYYLDLVGDTNGAMTLATAVFWSFGWVLLYGDSDNFLRGKGLKNRIANTFRRAPVTRSHIGRHVRSVQAVPARRRLVKPSQVSKQTARKPKPSFSTVLVTQTDTMQTYRSQRVKVHGNRSKINGGTGIPDKNKPQPKFTAQRDSKPDAINRGGLLAHSSGKGGTKDRQFKNGAKGRGTPRFTANRGHRR